MKKSDCSKIWLMTFLVGFFLALPPVALAQTVEIITEGSYQMGDNDTPALAEERALLKAKRLAVEEAGVYIASYTNIKNLKISDDNVISLAAGFLRISILDTQRTQVGNGMAVKVKIKAIVDGEKFTTAIKSTLSTPQIIPLVNELGVVKFNGVYQATSYYGQGNYYYYYYRFFPDGTVASYFTPVKDNLSAVYKSLEAAPAGKGKYSLQNGQLRFTLNFLKGNIDYQGMIVEDQLRLTFHSNIINTNGGYECKFIEMN